MSVKSIENRLCSSFYDMAWLNLSAGIENLPEQAEDPDRFRPILAEYRRMFLSTGKKLGEALVSGDRDQTKSCTEELLTLRQTLSDTVEELTRYRAEGRLLYNVLLRREAASAGTGTVIVEDEVRDLLGKMFASDDPMITNLRIRSMVAAFPMRMTRSRFYDRIAGYLSLYSGQEDDDGLRSFVYRLRGAAAIREEGKKPVAAFDFTENNLKPAREAAASEQGGDLDTVTQELGALNKQIDEAVSFLESIARCINPYAAIGLLSEQYDTLDEFSSVAEALRPAVAMQIAKALGEEVDASEYESAADRAHAAMEQYFEPLSVMMETETGRLQAEIDKMDDDTAEGYLTVMKAARLMSTSAFAELTNEPAAEVTPERVEECRDTLIRELDARFEGQPKAMVREIMAAVLAELPVWFDSRTEVMEYMLQSLQGCRTDGERRFAIRLLRAAL